MDFYDVLEQVLEPAIAPAALAVAVSQAAAREDSPLHLDYRETVAPTR